jgi:hypothetical protein
MSSPEKSDGALSSDHPPAVKAGGMRIVQNKSHLKDKKEGNAAVHKPEEDSSLKVSTSPPKSVTTQVSGALKKGDADFPKEAVESYMVKPVPTKDIHAQQPKPDMKRQIQQPRKQ